MTTREEIIALREEVDKFATNKLSCEGEYHPDFHTVSDERFYAIAFEAGRQAEREDQAKAIQQCGQLQGCMKMMSSTSAPILLQKTLHD